MASTFDTLIAPALPTCPPWHPATMWPLCRSWARLAAMREITGTGVWSAGLRYGDPAEVGEAAAELEELGYTALWIPDVGGEVFEAVDRLMAATKAATIATGILNLWMHSAEDTADAHARLSAAHGDRFLVGLGVSHAALIDAGEPGRYRKPLAAMAAFLDGLDAAPRPLASSRRVLAALGPKMLELARARAGGAHPYNVTPEHTALARDALGPSALVLPEQAVALTTDPDRGRTFGRDHLTHYLALPNYTNNLRRLGFGDDDFAAGGSARLIDALVAWGDVDAIEARVREHRDAGADHVCIQVLGDEGMLPRAAWRELAPAVTS
jgi:probable F420-dependent oxidoreductase